MKVTIIYKESTPLIVFNGLYPKKQVSSYSDLQEEKNIFLDEVLKELIDYF